MKRTEYAAIIADVLKRNEESLRAEFQRPGRIQTCYVDDVLPPEGTREIHDAFPKKEDMMERKTLREHKYVAAQMNKYNPLLEEIIYAFQDPRVLQTVAEITGLKDLHPDDRLYAGGISLMAPGNFLNPHLDNSHDKDRNMYRVLNLLFYVSPDWKKEYGGNLEVWDNGPEGEPREFHSKFNRLVIMATHDKSWHSVNKVQHPDRNRCCVSNYYFSPHPLVSHEYFHVTSFRGRPDEKVKDLVLQADNALRMGVRKVFNKGVGELKHVYKKEGDPQ
jgi:Rps23 Pro-64 3,4-dihydroxylase Tpa1-like proline 4-hydroxylase